MDWFERLTGFPESSYDGTRERLQIRGGKLYGRGRSEGYGVGALEIVSLHELRGRTRGISLPGRLRVDEVRGDVGRLHADPDNDGALFQVASQFNLLEMVDPSVSPEDCVTRYEDDPTQGPACAIAAGAATIYRNYFAPFGEQIGQAEERQIDASADLREALAGQLGAEPGELWQTKNGYALPNSTSLRRIDAHLRSISTEDRDNLRARLRVGVHRDVEVTNPARRRGQLVTQCFCSAMPVAYAGLPTADWAQLASLVLEAAYEATLLAGMENAARGRSERVLLTRLGGGAFGNAAEWIDRAISRALEIVQDRDLHVLMVRRP